MTIRFKTIISTIIILLMMGYVNTFAQTRKFNPEKYSSSNNQLMESNSPIDVVFIGNSITEGWVNSSPAFFSDNNYIGRGISGQETLQFLARFDADVLALNPKIVVINGGVNDIAQNLGKAYSAQNTFENVKAMVRLAQANDIQVILTSVLPAERVHWRPVIKNVPQKIQELNSAIEAFAQENNIPYVDYYSLMANSDRAMIAEYTTDGVHVTPEGYAVMEKLIKESIDKVLSDLSAGESGRENEND